MLAQRGSHFWKPRGARLLQALVRARCAGMVTRVNAGETLIKICGMRRKEDIEAANRCRPDYIGFILTAGYRRSVSPEEAEGLAQMLAPGILKVGVFVNEAVESVAAVSGFLDMIQLHGKEDNDYIRELREAAGKPIIQAVRIECTEDLEKAKRSEADILLLDNGTGTGQSFDWSLIGKTGEPARGAEYTLEKEGSQVHGAEATAMDPGRPWILAGGLGPDNIEEAVRRFRPYAVDLSSGAEKDGWKDPVKMEKCVRAVRNA